MNQRRIVNELAGDSPEQVVDIDRLFRGTIADLRNAHKKLDSLMQLLQDEHPHIESAAVAECIKSTANSVDEMNRLARTWQEEAEKVREKAKMGGGPGSLNTGVTNLTTGFARAGRTLEECLRILAEVPERYNEAEYRHDQLYRTHAHSLDDIKKETVFSFDKLLDGLGDE